MQAVQADWELIQALYQKGVTPKAIEAQTGVKADTVSVRAHRRGWRKALFAATAMLKGQAEAASGDPPAESKSQARSERIRAGLAGVLERSVAKIEQMSITSPAHALKVNQALVPVVQNCKTVLGWSDNATAPAIRIGVLAQVTIGPVSAPSPVPEVGQVIDTVTVTEIEPDSPKS